MEANLPDMQNDITSPFVSALMIAFACMSRQRRDEEAAEPLPPEIASGHRVSGRDKCREAAVLPTASGSLLFHQWRDRLHQDVCKI